MTKNKLKDFLGIEINRGHIDYEIIDTKETDQFDRHLVEYIGNEDDSIKAYLFIPKNEEIIGALLVHHQHNGERHFGKSEVAGIVGDEFQAFCPALAKKGFIALAPDSICFEDRRKNQQGTVPDKNPDNDWLQHYNEMCYRMLNGKTLMKKVLEDASLGINILLQQDEIEKNRIGILGHSYGGNTVIFQSALDNRIKFACSSGAVCSYKTKFENFTGIEMAEVIPNFTKEFDIEDLLKLIPPREFLILSADNDPYSQDANEIYSSLIKEGEDFFSIKEYYGGHRLDKERFDFVINWFVKKFTSNENS